MVWMSVHFTLLNMWDGVCKASHISDSVWLRLFLISPQFLQDSQEEALIVWNVCTITNQTEAWCMIRFLVLENTFTSFSSFFHKEFWLRQYAIVIYCDLVMCFILQILLIIWNHSRCVTGYRLCRKLPFPCQSHMVTDIPFVSWLLKRASCLEPLLYTGYQLDHIANRTPLFLFHTDYSPSHRPQSEPQ